MRVGGGSGGLLGLGSLHLRKRSWSAGSEVVGAPLLRGGADAFAIISLSVLDCMIASL